MSRGIDLLDHPDLSKVWVALESAAATLNLEDMPRVASSASFTRQSMPRRRFVATALTVLAVVIFAIWRLPSEESAAAAVRSAIERQADIESYEARTTTEYPDGRIESGTVRSRGNDAEVDGTLENPDGGTERFTITEVGGLVYISFGDENLVSPRAPNESIQPSIAELSKAIRGVLEDSDVTRAGNEEIAGSQATRYEIELNESSRAALADPVLGFDPERVVRLTIWVAGDYPRQVDWVLDDGEHTVFTFLNIDEDLEIVAPPGDYTFDPQPDLFD